MGLVCTWMKGYLCSLMFWTTSVSGRSGAMPSPLRSHWAISSYNSSSRNLQRAQLAKTQAHQNAELNSNAFRINSKRETQNAKDVFWCSSLLVKKHGAYLHFFQVSCLYFWRYLCLLIFCTTSVSVLSGTRASPLRSHRAMSSYSSSSRNLFETREGRTSQKINT